MTEQEWKKIKEELLFRIRKDEDRIAAYHVITGNCIYNWEVEEILIPIIDSLMKNRNRWISVEERLPDSRSHVLVSANGRVFSVDFFAEFRSVSSSGFVHGGFFIDNVTHWQELPEPFKESDN